MRGDRAGIRMRRARGLRFRGKPRGGSLSQADRDGGVRDCGSKRGSDGLRGRVGLGMRRRGCLVIGSRNSGVGGRVGERRSRRYQDAAGSRAGGMAAVLG